MLWLAGAIYLGSLLGPARWAYLKLGLDFNIPLCFARLPVRWTLSRQVVASTSSQSKLRCVHDADFDLDAVRSRLDEDGMAIAERQEESSKQRRTLAEATKGPSLTVTPSSPFFEWRCSHSPVRQAGMPDRCEHFSTQIRTFCARGFCTC